MDFSGLVGGGGFDLNSLFAKVSSLAPNWDPSPMLQQLTASGPGATPGLGSDPGAWSWMNNPVAQASVGATGTAIPGDPTKLQSGPLAGMPMLPTPPAAAASGAAPLSVQQLAALQAMQPKVPPQTMHPPAPVTPPNTGGRAIQFSPIGLPQTPSPAVAPSFAQILGRR